MYTLYFLPDACSLATQVILHELDQPVEIIHQQSVANFSVINPVGTVPVLINGDMVKTEGAAVILYLLNKHQNALLPATGEAREGGVENIMFANATMHPAYGRLFFIARYIEDEKVKQLAFEAAAVAINHLWEVVENKLTVQPYLGGNLPSAADIMLAVYSRWGANFPVEISLGENTQKMLAAVQALPSFQLALTNERAQT